MDLQYDTSIPRASLGIPHAQSASPSATSSVQSDNGTKNITNVCSYSYLLSNQAFHNDISPGLYF